MTRPDNGTRRSFLRAGLAGGLGLVLGDFDPRRARAGETTRKARARSLIQVVLAGGLAHQESFDPKSDAPREYRGAFGTVATSLPGVAFSELLPHTARVAGRLTLCRALTHDQTGHGTAQHYQFTGRPPAQGQRFPSLGSVVAHELGLRDGVPPYVCVPGTPSLHAGAGPLGPAAEPFSVAREPNAPEYSADKVLLPWEYDADLARTGQFSTRAVRQALDLAAEPAAMRDEYGRSGNGQRLLLARRLVAGARVVTVPCGGWDMHDALARHLKERLPVFDQAFAALVRDLERTGLLASTLVLVTTEFGRSPRVNGRGGRDHWPRVYSAVVAGGGVKQGFVYGASDALAAEPRDNPLSPEDLAATVYHLLGIDPAKQLTAGERTFPVVGGKVRSELLA
jgi:uncharacterized protein (DUF1501 family)